MSNSGIQTQVQRDEGPDTITTAP